MPQKGRNGNQLINRTKKQEYGKNKKTVKAKAKL